MTPAARLMLVIASATLGFMVALQAKTLNPPPSRPGPENRTSEAPQAVLQLQRDAAGLQAEAQRLQTELRRLGEQGEAYSALVRRVRELELAAGVMAVTGPGVVITLTYLPRDMKPGENPNAYRLQDEDLLRVVNELRAAGAEAISINGRRITMHSSVRCSAPTPSEPVPLCPQPPLEIRAVGDPEPLAGIMLLRGGIGDSLAMWSIRLDVQRAIAVTVPGAPPAPPLKFGMPTPTQP